jgi:hypothetical protein
MRTQEAITKIGWNVLHPLYSSLPHTTKTLLTQVTTSWEPSMITSVGKELGEMARFLKKTRGREHRIQTGTRSG